MSEPNPGGKRCDGCDHWIKQDVGDLGLCRHGPPMAVVLPSSAPGYVPNPVISVFPPMGPGGYCGQWRSISAGVRAVTQIGASPEAQAAQLRAQGYEFQDLDAPPKGAA